MKINRQDTNGVKPLLAVGELGYDNYPSGGDIGRVYVGTGSSNIAQAKKSEVVTVDGKVDTHVARIDNPHGVTKTQVGLSNVDNTADSLKVVASAGKWTTSRLINGTAVDGTTDVITSQWGTSRNITIGNTLKTVNGSGNVSWTLTEIGAIGTSSPAFTGIPTAPTAAVGTSNTVIATTEFVNAEIANDAIPRVVSTDNAIVRFDGVTGAVQNSTILVDDNGNLNITGIGKRITGDFSNLTLSNRVMFQNSNTNSMTMLGIVPSGTSTVAGSVSFGGSDVNNSPYYLAYHDGSKVFISADKNGTASYTPLTLLTGGAERMRIDITGNVLVTGGGGLGYGVGSGGSVTQLTSKSTAVTISPAKPSWQVNTSNSMLAAGASVLFDITNSTIVSTDNIILTLLTVYNDGYRVEVAYIYTGRVTVRLTNITAGSLSEAITINFAVIRGAIA